MIHLQGRNRRTETSIPYHPVLLAPNDYPPRARFNLIHTISHGAPPPKQHITFVYFVVARSYIKNLLPYTTKHRVHTHTYTLVMLKPKLTQKSFRSFIPYPSSLVLFVHLLRAPSFPWCGAPIATFLLCSSKYDYVFLLHFSSFEWQHRNYLDVFPPYHLRSSTAQCTILHFFAFVSSRFLMRSKDWSDKRVLN